MSKEMIIRNYEEKIREYFESIQVLKGENETLRRES